jgi:hypothetical protein
MARPSVRYGGGFMDIHPEQGSALAPPLVRCSVPISHTQYVDGCGRQHGVPRRREWKPDPSPLAVTGTSDVRFQYDALNRVTTRM